MLPLLRKLMHQIETDILNNQLCHKCTQWLILHFNNNNFSWILWWIKVMAILNNLTKGIIKEVAVIEVDIEVQTKEVAIESLMTTTTINNNNNNSHNNLDNKFNNNHKVNFLVDKQITQAVITTIDLQVVVIKVNNHIKRVLVVIKVKETC